MDLWLKARRIRLCALTITLVLGVVALGNDFGVALPNLIGASHVPVPLSLIPPLAIAIALASGLSGGNREVEMVAVRRVSLMDASYSVGVALAGLVGCVALSLVLPPGNICLAAGRDSLGYVGLMLLGRRLLGPDAGTVVPSMYLVLASLVRPTGTVLNGSWDWALASTDNPFSWLAALGLLASGTLASSRRRR